MNCGVLGEFQGEGGDSGRGVLRIPETPREDGMHLTKGDNGISCQDGKGGG